MNQVVSSQSRVVQPGRVAARIPAKAGRMSSKGETTKAALKLLPTDSILRASQAQQGAEDAQVLPLLAHATGAEAGFLVEYSAEGNELVCRARRWHGVQETVASVGPEIETLAAKALSTDQPAWRFSRASIGKFLAVVVPFKLPGGRLICLGVAVKDLRTGEGATIAALIQGYGWWLTSAASVRESRRESRLFERVSGFVEMMRHCAAAADVSEASGLMADHLKEILQCQSVSVVGYRRGSFSLLASSGGIEIEQRSEGRAAIEATVSEAVKRRETFVEAPGATVPSGAIGPAAEASRLLQGTGWVVVPMVENDEIVGGWFVLWSKEDPAFDEKVRFLRASAAQSAPLFSVLRKAKPEGFKAIVLRVWKRLSLSRKRLVIVLGLVLAALAVMPVKEKFSAPASLEPMVKRVVAAPFNATLRETKVEAGDLVESGDLLAELDGREIRFQLAEAIANKARAAKEADRALDAGKIAESQMSRLEALGFEQQQLISEERQRFLQIQSPIAGVVLQGDLERAEGAPLQTGDRLFEIAPIDEMLIEVALPQTEVAYVREGMPVNVQLEAFPGRVFEAVIERIPPRSELRQNRNVFVCEASIQNAEGELRPGMNGEAKVVGDRKMLIWTLIRPAVNYCRLKLWL
ncbi:MAG: efflux RND transporter periplasmic adaptor subunit [Verrucomicrobiales bacterium]|nr:efflux RND transporter periplasmic adaptor subunit [Verrucomicrobiales bacterium]